MPEKQDDIILQCGDAQSELKKSMRTYRLDPVKHYSISKRKQCSAEQ